jgi:hypothetical protein
LGGPSRAEPNLLEALFDLSPPVREVLEGFLVDAGQVGDPVLDRPPFDAECAGELVAEVGLVEVAGGLRVLVQESSVEGSPFAVDAFGHVRHQPVGVQMRVPGPARAMPEPRCDQPAHVDLGEAVLADP